MQDKLKSMIQLREPPFDVDAISTLDAMDGVLEIDGGTTLRKTAILMKRAGVKKRPDGKWNLQRVRQRGNVLSEWQAPETDGRTAGRDPIYPFTKMEFGDAVSFSGQDFTGNAYNAAMVYGHRTGKKFSGMLWTKANGERGITIKRTDNGDHLRMKKRSTDIEAVRALIDWKAGCFVNDLVTASDAVETLNGIIPGITPVKAGLLLRGLGGTKKIRIFTGKRQIWVWIIRNLREYENLDGGKLWRLYQNERKILQ